MKVLWISYISSWTPTLLNAIKHEVEVAFIIPTGGFENFCHTEDGVTYYSLHLTANEIKRTMTRETFRKYLKVLEIEKPLLIHVHGTETNFAQVQNFTDIPVVVSIQGILDGYKPYYNNFLRDKMLRKYNSLKNILGYGGLRGVVHNFDKGTEQFERDILTKSKYFFCRTNWDKAWVKFSNPNAKIFQGEELLRKAFYENAHSWSIDKCVRHSIFMPSGFNPIKGMYLAVKALHLLKSFYDDVHLVVPGVSKDEVFVPRWKGLLFGEKYIRYIRHLIEEYSLHDDISFLGRLSAEGMVEQMQKAHVFLSPSSIDNSPNAVGEATMIGTPVVTTPVGGVPSMLKDEESCLFAPAGDDHMMAYQIMRIFEDVNLACNLSKNEGIVANRRHDKVIVPQNYIDSYKLIIKNVK